MACFHPVDAFYRSPAMPGGGKQVFFGRPPAYVPGYSVRAIKLPCGHCKGCRLEYSRGWAVRCVHEAQMYEDNCFITLTYRPDTLPNDPSLNQPESGTLVRKDLQLFMKRLRREEGAGIRFYGCGEYGSKLGRPHYHACIFNYRPDDLRPHKEENGHLLYTSKKLEAIWNKGFVTIGSLTFQSAAYVARYIMKKINGDMKTQHYENVSKVTGLISTLAPEFPAMSTNGPSKGIGHDWYKKYGYTDCHDHDFIIFRGKKMRPPRYYDKLLEAVDPERMARIKSERMRNASLHEYNNTPDRLAVREELQSRKLGYLPRTYDDEDL